MKILLIRGLDQFFFRGMDVLGQELANEGHTIKVKAPMFASHDTTYYDVVIGNSQGAVSAMNRDQNFGKLPPKMIITVDVPDHPGWKAHKGVKHLNIRGRGWGKVAGAENIFIDLSHYWLSYSPEMRQKVREFIFENK